MDSLQLANRTVLLRVDFNMKVSRNGVVDDNFRLRSHVSTIQYLQKQGAKVVLLSHRGRPRGEIISDFSLRPWVGSLKKLLDCDVSFVPDCVGRMAEQSILRAPPKAVVLLENLRFHRGEEENSEAFAMQLAKLGDVYVNDAFATSHRKHASIVTLPQLLPSAAGFLMLEEVNRVQGILEEPSRPLTMIIGGARLARKLDVLRNAVFCADQVIVGGAIANTVLAAKDFEVGRSLIEPDYIEAMRDLMVEAGIVGCRILLPQDVMVAPVLQPGIPATSKLVEEMNMDDMILDIGPRTLRVWSRVLQSTKTVVWHGPVGAYEVSPYDEGTYNIANAVIHSDAVSLAAGHNTLSALKACDLRENFDALSTSSTAFINLMAGIDLVGLKMLREATNRVDVERRSFAKTG